MARCPVVARIVAVFAVLLLWAGVARAQQRREDKIATGELLDENGDDTPREEDPISMGGAAERDVPDVAPDAGVPTTAPTAPPIASVRGPVLAAVPGVRERSHAVEVRLKGEDRRGVYHATLLGGRMSNSAPALVSLCAAP